jgi:hypothetical protein
MISPDRKPTLEDLIRVKRAERPPAEFWQRFEEELRAKQLAAIVEKRPWWQPLSRLVAGRQAWFTGLGAVAAVGVAFLGLRPAQPVAVPSVSPSAPVVAAAQPPAAPVSAVPVVAAPAPAAPVVMLAAAAPEAAPVTAVVAESESLSVASVVNPVLEVKFDEVQVPPPFSALEAAVPVATLAFARHALSDSAPAAEPLAGIPTPREQQTARLASVVELAMLGLPTTSAPRARATPREADLRDREMGRISAQGGLFGMRF